MVGVDISRAMVEQRREDPLLTENVVADMEALPFANGAFDAVLFAMSLHHVPDPRAGASRGLPGASAGRGAPGRRALRAPGRVGGSQPCAGRRARVPVHAPLPDTDGSAKPGSGSTRSSASG